MIICAAIKDTSTGQVFLIIITFIICLAMIDDMDNGLR